MSGGGGRGASGTLAGCGGGAAGGVPVAVVAAVVVATVRRAAVRRNTADTAAGLPRWCNTASGGGCRVCGCRGRRGDGSRVGACPCWRAGLKT